MPENLPSIIIGSLFIGIWLLVLIRLVGNKLAPVKTVKAQVTHKHIQEVFSKYSGNGKSYKYVVVFTAEGKTLSFYVSEFSYNGYKVNERGTLTYKGNRLIKFE